MSRNDSKASPEAELLADVVQSLAEELKVLRIAVDELREELQWANHNVHRDEGNDEHFRGSRRIHSVSLDPTSADFAVNSVSEETVEQLRSGLTPIKSCPGQQGELFS